MSLQLNDTTNFRGIVQEYEEEIGADVGFISGNTQRLKQFVSSVNQALDDFVKRALQASGTWQWDDSNQTDYPIVTTNLVSGQRDYSFTTDEGGNIILDVYKVMVADSSGIFSEIKPKDVQSESDTVAFYDGRNGAGTPNRYDKTANAVFLDPIPNYSYTNGLKMYINREASYFTYTDTTKKPGVPGIFHRYFVIRPAEDYTRRNNKANYTAIRAERIALEESIDSYYALRPKDEQKRVKAGYQDNR